jgi:hypothetical protein
MNFDMGGSGSLLTTDTAVIFHSVRVGLRGRHGLVVSGLYRVRVAKNRAMEYAFLQ